MVLLILGVVNELLAVDNGIPPDAAAYQSITLPDDAAEINTVPVPHLCPLVPVGTEGIEFMDAITAVLVDEKQPVDTFLASA